MLILISAFKLGKYSVQTFCTVEYFSKHTFRIRLLRRSVLVIMIFGSHKL